MTALPIINSSEESNGLSLEGVSFNLNDDISLFDDTITEPNKTESETKEPDTLEPDTLEPDTLEPDTLEPDTLEPDTLEPDTLEPNTLEPDTLEPDTLEPDKFMPGQFLYIEDRHSRKMIKNAFDSVTQLELWPYMKQEMESFMLSNDNEINLISCKMVELGYDLHSGFSFGWTMRQIQFIAKYGEEKFMESWISCETNKV